MKWFLRIKCRNVVERERRNEKLLRTCNPRLTLNYLVKVLIVVYRQTAIEASKEKVYEREAA